MVNRGKTNTFFGLLAGLIASVFGKNTGRTKPADLAKTEFKASTQRLGLTFTEKIRDTFRFKWLKKRQRQD
jgi:hypothetical protein